MNPQPPVEDVASDAPRKECRCPACGYLLIAESGECPECGAPFHRADLLARKKLRPWSRIARDALILAIVSIVASVVVFVIVTANLETIPAALLLPIGIAPAILASSIATRWSSSIRWCHLSFLVLWLPLPLLLLASSFVPGEGRGIVRLLAIGIGGAGAATYLVAAMPFQRRHPASRRTR